MGGMHWWLAAAMARPMALETQMGLAPAPFIGMPETAQGPLSLAMGHKSSTGVSRGRGHRHRHHR